MAELMESVAANLQQRIGQIVSQYEADLAVLRAQAGAQLDEKDKKIAELEDKLKSDVVSEGKNSAGKAEAVAAS